MTFVHTQPYTIPPRSALPGPRPRYKTHHVEWLVGSALHLVVGADPGDQGEQALGGRSLGRLDAGDLTEYTEWTHLDVV